MLLGDKERSVDSILDLSVSSAIDIVYQKIELIDDIYAVMVTLHQLVRVSSIWGVKASADFRQRILSYFEAILTDLTPIFAQLKIHFIFI